AGRLIPRPGAAAPLSPPAGATTETTAPPHEEDPHFGRPRPQRRSRHLGGQERRPADPLRRAAGRRPGGNRQRPQPAGRAHHRAPAARAWSGGGARRRRLALYASTVPG